jgi:hypothetical protein
MQAKPGFGKTTPNTNYPAFVDVFNKAIVLLH